MHGLIVYVKEGLPLAQDLSLENSADSYLCFRLALFHSMSYFFFLYRSPSSTLCTIFYSILSNIDEVFPINPSAVFVFGDFNVCHKDWLTYSCGTDPPGQLCYNFSISNDLGSQTVILIVLLFQIYLFLLALVFVLQWLSLHWEILIMLLSPFPLTFHQIYNGMPRFIAYLMTILVLIGMVSVIIWEMFHRRISLNLVLLLLLVKFVSGFGLELIYPYIHIHIPHIKYQIKPHSSASFSAAYDAATVHRNQDKLHKNGHKDGLSFNFNQLTVTFLFFMF